MSGVTIEVSFTSQIRLDWCVIEALRGNTIGVTFRGVALGVSSQVDNKSWGEKDSLDVLGMLMCSRSC